jgi:hypothetical protein
MCFLVGGCNSLPLPSVPNNKEGKEKFEEMRIREKREIRGEIENQEKEGRGNA